MDKNILSKKRRLNVGLAIILSFLVLVGKAQYLSSPPTIDGTADVGYSTSGAWSLAWDENYLYVRYSGGGATEPAIFNIDVDPQVPVSGGSNSNGSLVGQTNWGITPTLPFRADYMIYWESQYAEYRTDNGAGGWSTPTVITTSDRSNNTSADREIRLSWTSMGLSGRPTFFNWFGFANSRATPGFIFNQTPGNNPSGFNSTPKINYYYTVSNTSNSNTTNPFSRISFEHREAYDIYITGNTTLYDITNNANNVNDQIIIENNSSLVTVQIDGTANLYGGIIVSGADILQYNSGAICLINGNGYTSTQNGGSITYNQTNSTLIYNSGSAYTFGNEWPSTNGPITISLSNGTTLIITASRTINASGSMTINPLSGITISSGNTLTTNNNLIIKSSVSGDGYIGNSAGAVSGSVTVERYVPALSNKRYRFLSSPVSTTVADWRGEIFITGGGTSSEFSSVGVNNVKTNGLDWTLSGAPSMFAYTENLNSGGLNTRWESITSGGTTLVAGKGYRVFVRGDRSNAGVLDNSITTQSAVTITSVGSINAGSQTLPVTYNGSTSDDGWNLVGNPYPSTIDWNASSGWTKTNLTGTIYIYNPSTNSYGNFDGTTPTNGVTRYISSGQAFFVRTNASSPALSCTEAVKTTNAGAAIFKTNVEENTLRISLIKNEINKDEAVIRFMEGKNNEFSENDDVRKFYNSTVNVSSYFNTDTYVSVNYLNNKLTEDKVIQISAWGDEVGTYTFSFKGIENFNLTERILLKDKFLNNVIEINDNSNVSFDITTDPNSKGDNRFEIIFVAKTSTKTSEELLKLSSTNLSVYPNPATDVLNINISNANFKNSEVVVYNISGIEVFKTNMASSNAQLNIESLSNGVYFVKVSNQNGFNKTVKFVK